MTNHEPKHPPADMAGLDGLIERLRAIPVWMVEAMTPGWQTHGTAAYEATTQLQALAARVKMFEGLLREAEVKLTDVQGAYATGKYAANLLARISAALKGGEQ